MNEPHVNINMYTLVGLVHQKYIPGVIYIGSNVRMHSILNFMMTYKCEHKKYMYIMSMYIPVCT